MLTTDKNEIIESMCEDIEGASDSAIAWLADTFDVSLPDDDSKYVGDAECLTPDLMAAIL